MPDAELVHLVRDRHLPAVPSGFVIGDREPLPEGLRRISLEQLDHALDGLVSGDEIDTAVHEARKAMKRLRAILRLVRDEIGDRIYRAENVTLRDTARLIAPVRDGAVLTETVEDLRERYADQLRPGTFADLQGRLSERHRYRRQRALDDQGVLAQVIRTLHTARARYASWPVEDDDPIARAYGIRPIRHDFDALAGGLARTYGRGREEMERVVAEPTAHNFHQWRKRVKYLRHQMEILEPIWPDVVGGYASALDDLGDLLGEEHDLAELLGLVASLPELCPDPAERSLLAALAQHRRRELQQAALGEGRRAYAEPTKRFVSRIGAYWEAFDQPVGALEG